MYFKTLYLVVIAVFISSCIPQEKSTKCDSNEAYDSSSRKCVATLGAESSTINITNVTPSSSYAVSKTDATKTHTVSISDPYNNGYQVRWSVIQEDGSSTLLGTGLSISFNHTLYPEGNYILEVQVLNSDGTRVYDSRSWSVYVIDDVVPTIARITSSPFTTTITNSATTIKATAYNPDGILGVNYEWFVNGTSVAGESGAFSTGTQALSFDFYPSSHFDYPTNSLPNPYYAGSSVYTVQVVLSENATGAIFDTETWVITNNLPEFGDVSLGTSPTHLTQTPTTASIITTISGLSIGSSGFLYDVNSDNTLDAVDFCVMVDEINGVNGDGVYVDFLFDGVAIPAATNKQMTSTGTSYCLGNYNNFAYTLPANIVQESHTISAVVYDKFSGTTSKTKYNGYTQIEKLNWTIRVRQKNSPPTLSIANANQSVISCYGSTPTTQSGCTITQDTTFRLAITVDDDDFSATDYGQYKVEFYLDNILLDGSHPKVTATDCYHDYGQTNTSAKYLCDITINSYDTNGPVNVSGLTYNLYAKVTDTGILPYGGTPEESNLVYWSISTVNESFSDPVISPFAADDPDLNTTPTKSYVSDQSTPADSIDLDGAAGVGDITEGDIIQFHVKVSDAERDSHTIKIERCFPAGCNVGRYVPALSTSTVNSTNNNLVKETIINHQVGEDEVTAGAAETVNYRITVTDSSNGNSVLTDVSILVNDNNPDPEFNTANFNPAIPSNLTTFAGFPVTIDPGAITDASIKNGTLISYQWQYIVDTDRDNDFSDEVSGYMNIDGATEKVLTWIPSPTIDANNFTNNGTEVRVRLCLGDDGRKSDGTLKLPDCSSPSLDTSGGVFANAWDMTVFSNMSQGKSFDDNNFTNASFGEVATWVDPTSTNPVIKYMAYVNFAREIVIEKIVTLTNGTKEGSVQSATPEIYSIKFNVSTDLNYSTNNVSSLSIAGDPVGKALYLAYMTPISGVDQVHVRRIDISGGKTGFTHDGKFGWDPGYNDLVDNIVIASAGIDPETVNSDGEVEITFTDAASNTGMSITFSGIMGGSATLTAGSEFCIPVSGCTTVNATATEFANAINASTEPELQGITASVTAGVVTLEGIVDGDFIEADIGATKIGQIMVNNDGGTLKWQLPLIDHDLSGADKNKISLLEGDLGVRLSDANLQKTFLPNTEQAQEIANDLDGTYNMIIAIKAMSSGEIRAYEYDAQANFREENPDVFSDNNITNIKVAASKENTDFIPSVYLTGSNSDNRLAYARFDDFNGLSPWDYEMIPGSGGTSVQYKDLDPGFSVTKNLDKYDISAGSSSNQLLVLAISDPAGGADYNAYLLNIKGAVPKIDCSYDSSQTASHCQPLFPAITEDVFNLNVSLGEVLKSVSIGDDGATTGEATNDILPVVYQIDGGGGSPTNDAKPISGLINSSPITVTSDENNAGIGHMLPYVSP